MNLEEQIYATYQYFFIKYVNNETYLYVPTDSHKKSTQRFIKFLEKEFGVGSVSVNVLFNFFALQFCHYSEPNAIKSKRYLQITHIMGPKAIERWRARNYYKEQEVKQWCAENKCFISELNEIVNYQPSLSLNKLEEIERKRFHNTEYGLSHCLSVTDGYNAKSESCKLCKYSIECRNIQ